ncbi:MAG: GNAT family N-acetyltransferase [Halanaerobiales bacterium]
MFYMTDMLVKLYDLPSTDGEDENLQENKIVIRRVLTPEKSIIVDWINIHFSVSWADQAEIAFSRQPVSCFIALEDKDIVGFACYDVTCKNFFGPMGVYKDYRGNGIGRRLLLKSLEAMTAEGYAYAIIGDIGPAEFYKKVVGATIIPDSTPGIYENMLRE